MSLFGLPGIDITVWLDFAKHGGFTLRLGTPQVLWPDATEFWIELVAPNGEDLLGWLRFELFGSIKGQVIWSVVEWRPADGLAPPPESAWLGSKAPRQERT